MRRCVLTALLSLSATAALRAGEPIDYRISFDNAFHHEANVEVRFRDVGRDVLELRMSRSSPGRYALHEFAKNVYDVRATDGAGRVLDVSRPNPHQWDVSGHDGTVEITYKIFGDRCDGTYLAVDATHAHVNSPATFMWARGLEDRPIEITIVPFEDHWKVATQLVPGSGPFVFTAPDLYYFLDSPIEVSAFDLYEWDVASNGRSQRIRLALHHEGSRAQGAAYARLAESVVNEQVAIFGELPEFDFGTYTFIADYLPYVDGDGMEHRNSTILSTSRSLDRAVRNLGTVAHEFFHAWNVERLRPKSLEPFDFERANMSGELWFAEGFTSYYDDLTLKRAGIVSLDRFARALSGVLSDVLNAPGRRFFSPVGMSLQAPFVDAAVSVDPTNRRNTFASYYPYGAVVALGLDLSIRARFAGKSLDDLMRAAWTEYGRSEVPYTIEDLERLLGDVTEPAFARAFFEDIVYESGLPEFAALLPLAGLDLVRPKADEIWLGAEVHARDGQLRLAERTLHGSPLYEAGLDIGDVVLELGERSVSDEASLGAVLEAYAPGDSTTIVFEKRGGTRHTSPITFAGNPDWAVTPFEHAGREVTPDVRAFRKAWLSSKTEHPELERHCPVCERSYPFEREYCHYDGASLRLTPGN